MPNPSRASSPADFAKFFTAFQVPAFDLETIAATQRKNFEALNAAGQRTLEGLQTVLRRQIEITSELAGSGSSGVQDIFSVGSPQAKIAKQADAFKTSLDKSLAHLRELSEIIGQSNREAVDVLTRRFDESFAELQSAFRTA